MHFVVCFFFLLFAFFPVENTTLCSSFVDCSAQQAAPYLAKWKGSFSNVRCARMCGIRSTPFDCACWNVDIWCLYGKIVTDAGCKTTHTQLMWTPAIYFTVLLRATHQQATENNVLCWNAEHCCFCTFFCVSEIRKLKAHRCTITVCVVCSVLSYLFYNWQHRGIHSIFKLIPPER